MCTLNMKETIEYYVHNSRIVFCTMLDATKAFDRVEYCRLFRLLIDRGLPPVVMTLLVNLYTNHVKRIAWNGVLSSTFEVLNCVKQGGVLSSVFLCVYIDGLLATLKDASIGCHIGSQFVGVLAYADDIVLLAPTPDALRLMLKLCDRCANIFNILFNASKSKCLIVRPRGMTCGIPVTLLTFYYFIGGHVIEIVNELPHIAILYPLAVTIRLIF